MSDNLLWAINIILLIWAGYLLHSLFWHGKVLGKPVRMKEVWSKQSLMEDMGNLADGFRSDLKRIVLEKGIPDLQVFESPIGLGGNEYLIFQRKLGLGLFTSMAVSMEPHGVDLAVDVRRMEISLLGTSSNVLRVFFGIAFIGAGLLTIALMGAGIILIIVGIFLIPWKVTSALSNDYKSKSEFLSSAVTQSLDKVLHARIR